MADETANPEADTETPATETPATETPEAETPADDQAGTPAAETPATLTGAALIDTLDKDGLEAYARAEFGREIDKRKRIDTLRAEVRSLLDGSTQQAEADAAAVAARDEARATQTPIAARHKYLTNPETGEPWEFEWNDLYAKNADLEPVYAD